MPDPIPWIDLAEVYGFIGNSLLKPMTQTEAVGVDPEFWESFPDFDEPSIREALSSCKHYAEQARVLAVDGGDPVEKASVEYTRLFVGPPSPAAAPWETMYRSEGVSVGFGEPTFEMKKILREAGLELSNENRQYEDHMGIELLYLSTCCSTMSSAEIDTGSSSDRGSDLGSGLSRDSDDGSCSAGSNSAPDLASKGEDCVSADVVFGSRASGECALLDFIEQHPLRWIGTFRGCVAEAYPDGYFAALLAVAESVLAWHAKMLGAGVESDSADAGACR